MELTIFERFWLWRRQNRLTQTEAGRMLGCSRSTVYLMETGRAWPTRWLEEWSLPVIPSPGEEVRLLRRRANIEAEDMAALLDVSRITLYRIENDEINMLASEIAAVHKAIVYHQKAGNWPKPGKGQVRK